MNEAQGFLLTIVAIALIIAGLLVLPFVQFVLIAVLLAYVLYPLQQRLASRIGGIPAAFVLVAATMVVIVVPLFVLVLIVSTRAIQLLDEQDLASLGVDELERAIHGVIGQDIDLVAASGEYAEMGVQTVLGTATEFASAFVHGLLGIGMAAFLLFFFLKDGDLLGGWIERVVPLPSQVQFDMHARFEQLIWAVVVGHVGVALVQGVLAGLGLWATGVPNAIFWTVVMIGLALIPLIGSFLVWAPAAAWLVMTGSTAAGIALFIYGLFVVGLSDEFLRPLIIGQVDVNPATIIVGVIGGVYLLGFIGLFFGPVIVGGLKAVIDTYAEWYTRL